MKKTLSVLAAALFCLAACKKSSSSSNSGTTFTATINGTATTFNVQSATLLRSQSDNEKRMDITGLSTDKSKMLTLTLGQETYLGSGMAVKTYVLNPFPPDDPNTPNVDESLTTQGFTTYGIAAGNSWIYNVYDEDGAFIISSCDSAHATVTGTFQTTLTDNTTTPATVITIKDGKISGLKYKVLN